MLSYYNKNKHSFLLRNLRIGLRLYCTKEKSPLGTPNKLALGCNGWIFGYDNDYANHHFAGITLRTDNKAKTAWFAAVNYKVAVKAQMYEHSYFKDKAEAVCDAILCMDADHENITLPWLIDNNFVRCNDNKLSANFLVFETEVFEKICKLTFEISEEVANCMIDISDKAEKILAEHAPASLKGQCGDIAKIHHRLDVAAFLMEELIKENKLIVPNEKTPLCIWGVKA